jgi:2-keto-4-pentenoate hydratase
MSTSSFDPVAAARFIADAHAARQAYCNLPGPLAPPSIDAAYLVQEELRKLWEPRRGAVAGLKIAVTTKVMQELMGIDHPCGGMIYGGDVHAAPHKLEMNHYMHVVLEFELAVRVGRTLSKKATPWSREEVRAEIAEVMPAFELIEDRNAVYRETQATTLIADNAWNAGIVLGKPVVVPPTLDLDGLVGRLTTPSGVREGRTDDPMGALAWCANLAADRGRPLEAGQVVITGSVIPTLPIARGETFAFDLEGLGSIEISATT